MISTKYSPELSYYLLLHKFSGVKKKALKKISMSVGQEFRRRLTGQFWLNISHEIHRDIVSDCSNLMA